MKYMSKTHFCHISPINYLHLTKGRDVHLTLAHLVDNKEYTEFYKKEKANGSIIIMDNSAFEFTQQGKGYLTGAEIVDYAKKIDADYAVMTDYPGEDRNKTIDAAKEQAPMFKEAGLKTFFVPQGKVGDKEDYIECFRWASENPELINYIGYSILAVPNAYGIEPFGQQPSLHRMLSRLHMMYTLAESGMLGSIRKDGQKLHFLGMVDGPNEVQFLAPFRKFIDSWDSSSAIWHGLNGYGFDDTPGGLMHGKYHIPVDFHHKPEQDKKDNDFFIKLAKENMDHIDKLVYAYLWGNEDKEVKVDKIHEF